MENKTSKPVTDFPLREAVRFFAAAMVFFFVYAVVDIYYAGWPATLNFTLEDNSNNTIAIALIVSLVVLVAGYIQAGARYLNAEVTGEPHGGGLSIGGLEGGRTFPYRFWMIPAYVLLLGTLILAGQWWGLLVALLPAIILFFNGSRKTS